MRCYCDAIPSPSLQNFCTQFLSKSFPVCLHTKHAAGEGGTHKIHLFELQITAAKRRQEFYSGFLFSAACITQLSACISQLRA